MYQFQSEITSNYSERARNTSFIRFAPYLWEVELTQLISAILVIVSSRQQQISFVHILARRSFYIPRISHNYVSNRSKSAHKVLSKIPKVVYPLVNFESGPDGQFANQSRRIKYWYSGLNGCDQNWKDMTFKWSFFGAEYPPFFFCFLILFSGHLAVFIFDVEDIRNSTGKRI